MEEDEIRDLLSKRTEQDDQYMRERPWIIAEYERMGFTDEMKQVREGIRPLESPGEASRVTTDDMRVGVLPTDRKVQEDRVSPPADDEVEDDYDTLTVAQLQEEIDVRNRELPDEDKITRTGKKEDLIARLRADDEAADEE